MYQFFLLLRHKASVWMSDDIVIIDSMLNLEVKMARYRDAVEQIRHQLLYSCLTIKSYFNDHLILQ